jgi:hypothetical protein
MATTAYSAERASARAKELYESNIRRIVEPEHNGEYLVMNLDTGEYVVGDDTVTVSKLAAARFSGAARFGIRVGQWVVGRVGGRVSVHPR